MTDESRVPLNRTERILAAMIAGIGGLSILALVSVLVARAIGESEFTGGIWPAVVVTPTVGLPITFALVLAFLVVSAVRRRRLERDGGR